MNTSHVTAANVEVHDLHRRLSARVNELGLRASGRLLGDVGAQNVHAMRLNRMLEAPHRLAAAKLYFVYRTAHALNVRLP